MPAPIVAMAAKQLLANPKTRKLIIGGVTTTVILVGMIPVVFVMAAGGAIAAIEGGSNGSGSPVSVGAGVSGALPINSAGFQKLVNSPAGTMVIEYPGNNLPPPSLVSYALPGVTVPSIGVPPKPPNGNGIQGQCTYWAELNWVPPAGKSNVILRGNGDQLAASAKAQGVPISNIPAPGEVVSWGAGHGYDPNYGHTAVVVAVNPANGTYVVSEMNYSSAWEIDYRVVSDSAGDVLGFITTGLTVPGPTASPTP